MEFEANTLPVESLGRRIRFLRTKACLTQNDLAKKLNVTRQALSNWERDVNMPDLALLEQICTIFGVHMNELLQEAMNMELEMETGASLNKTADNKRFFFNKYDLAIGLFYLIGLCLGTGIFFVGGLLSMSGTVWAACLFAGACAALSFGLTAHAIITLIRKDR